MEKLEWTIGAWLAPAELVTEVKANVPMAKSPIVVATAARIIFEPNISAHPLVLHLGHA